MATETPRKFGRELFGLFLLFWSLLLLLSIVTFDISDQLAFEIAYVTTFYSDIPMDTLTATVDEDYNVTSVTIGYENHVENDPQYGTYTEGAKYVFELVTAEEIGVPKNIENYL